MSSHLDALIAKAKQKVDSKNRAKTAKLPDGRSRWRILPPINEAADFYHDFGQHFVKGSDGKVKAVYMCVDKTYGKPCAVCDAVSKAMISTSDDNLLKIVKESAAGSRVLLNALHVDGSNPTEPQILEVPPTVFNEFVRLLGEWGAELFDMKSGRDIIIERTGKGIGTKYSVQVTAKPSAVANAAEVMKKATDLADYVKQESEDGKMRAIQNLNAVAGLTALPASVGGSASSSLSDVLIDDDEDPTMSIPSTSTRVVEEEAAPVSAAAPAPSAPASGSDTELDDLIASLG